MTRVLLSHPSAELYGSDRMALEAAAALVRAGASVHVALPGDGPLVPKLREIGAKVDIVDAPVIRKSALRPAGFARLAWQLVRSAPRMRGLVKEIRPDVVYINTIVQPWWGMVGRVAGKRVVFHVREAETDAPAIVRRALLTPLRTAHSIIANSVSTAHQVAADCPPLQSRTTVIYNGKDWSRFSELPPPDLKGALRLLFIGRLSPRKGPDLIIDALKSLTQAGHSATLDIAGAIFPGYEWYERQLRERVIEHGLGSRVRFLGFVEDTPAIIANADVLVVPSRVEPFGTVAAEGMAASRPVIVSNVQGLTEIVEAGRTGYIFPSDDVRELTGRIVEILSNPAEARTRAEAGKSSVLARFSPERYASEICRAVLPKEGRTVAA